MISKDHTSRLFHLACLCTSESEISPPFTASETAPTRKECREKLLSMEIPDLTNNVLTLLRATLYTNGNKVVPGSKDEI